MTPRTKNLILEKYKLSNAVLNEPNIKEKTILSSLNKTVEALFREVTYKLNKDFDLLIKLWFYEEEQGWRGYEEKILEGNENYIKVRNHRRRKVHERILTILAAQPGPNGQLYETTIYLKLNDIICGTF